MRLLATLPGLALSLVGALPLACSTGTPANLVAARSRTSDTSLDFDGDGPLVLAPGAVQSLSVTATPPTEYGVLFTLIGPSDGARLVVPSITTGKNGRGMVTLIAPDQAATFAVHAALLDAKGTPTMTTAERVVTVSQPGSGSLLVEPSYTGKRIVATWTASASPYTKCATLALEPPQEPPGAITATAAAGADPLILDVPLGTDLAVAVRAGHFLWGCTDIGGLTAGSPLAVPVPVADVPLDFTGASLPVTLDYTTDPRAYQGLLDDAVASLVDAFMPSDPGAGAIVLNGMAAAISAPSDLTAFMTDRSTMGWDALASAHFAGLSPGLIETCQTWAAAGVAQQPMSFQATLTGGSLPGEVGFALTRIGDLDQSSAAVTTDAAAPYSWLPGDTVQINAAVAWTPSAFAGAASLLPAQQAQPGASTVAAALAIVADCHGLSLSMGSFGQCGSTCIEALCGQAIASRWTAALGLSGSAPGHLQIQATATATVDDMAHPVALQGQWQGSLDDGVVTVAISQGTLQP